MATTLVQESGVMPLIYYKGVPFPGIRVFDEEKIKGAVEHKAIDGDIVLCSYPKTGFTWMTYIVLEILKKAESFPGFEESGKMCPYLEVTGVEALETLEKPRFYRNHLPYNLLKINEKAKYIYVHRNPEDTVVSFYHFNNGLTGEQADFNAFFEAFMDGKVPYGDFFDHVLSYYAHKDEDYLLLVSYEQLKRNTESEILRIAKFLGEEYHRPLEEDDSLVKKIVEVTSFDYMKKNLEWAIRDKEGQEKKRVNFFRKGVVGDGKNQLSEGQRERLRNRMHDRMKGTELLDLWSQL